MIHISLLPEKLRRVEGTPLPRQLTIYIGVAVCSGLMALNAVFLFNRIPDAEEKLGRLQTRVTAETARAKEVDAMEASIAAVRTRIDAAQQLYRKRIVWAKLLSDLRDIVNKQQIDPASREYVWFTKLTFVAAKGTKSPTRTSRTAAPVKKEPDEFLILEGWASAPSNNRALEMGQQLFKTMQEFVPDKSNQEDVLQDLLKKQRLWDQRVAAARKAGKQLTDAEENAYKGIRDRIQHLETHSSGQIAKRSFASFIADWGLPVFSWETNAFGKASSSDANATMPVDGMRFTFKIGFKPQEDPTSATPTKRGK